MCSVAAACRIELVLGSSFTWLTKMWDPIWAFRN
jgi:hypothetical protein